MIDLTMGRYSRAVDLQGAFFGTGAEKTTLTLWLVGVWTSIEDRVQMLSTRLSPHKAKYSSTEGKEGEGGAAL